MQSKKGTWVLPVSIGLVVLLVLGIFLYFALFSPGYDSYYINQFNSGQLVNPVSGLTIEEAKMQFNESFVYYLLYSIKAYNLHNPPLSSDTPKIEIFVESDVYNSEIMKGAMYVNKGSISEKDMIIKTNKEEAIKMLQNKNYVEESFANGGSSIELVSGKSTLFGKGYLSLYKSLTGKSVTGSVVKIYAD